MATNIDINDITNATEVNNGTGVFDKLIKVAFLHISQEVDENRLTQSGAGEVYAAAIQSAMSQAIQFVLQEKQLEAQIDLTIAQTDELLLNGVKERELKDSQIIGSGYDNQVKEQQVLESKYKVEELLPAELLQLQKQVDVAERGMVEQELTGVKQRLAIDKDNLLKDDELVINNKKKSQIDAQTSEMLDGTLRANIQLDDMLLTNEKQRDILTTEKLIKAYENNTLQPDAHNANLKQIEVLAVDKSIKSYQLSDILPKEAIMLTEQKETADAQQLALAKDLEIKDIQKQVTYVERVIKDKEAAALGMDNAIKISQTSKASDDTYVYTPQYEEL